MPPSIMECWLFMIVQLICVLNYHEFVICWLLLYHSPTKIWRRWRKLILPKIFTCLAYKMYSLSVGDWVVYSEVIYLVHQFMVPWQCRNKTKIKPNVFETKKKIPYGVSGMIVIMMTIGNQYSGNPSGQSSSMSSAKVLNFRKKILFNSVSIMVSEYIKLRDQSFHVISSTWTPSGDKCSVYMVLSGCGGGFARIFHNVNTYAIIAHGIVNYFINTHVQFKTGQSE